MKGNGYKIVRSQKAGLLKRAAAHTTSPETALSQLHVGATPTGWPTPTPVH